MSADSLVCRPCRQDVTRVVTDPGHTPRWGRDVGTKSKNLCSVLNCTKISFAHAAISTGELPQGIQFRTKPTPTPTPLCKHHYHAVYDAQETRQRNCRTCGRRLWLGNDRPCPHPDVVQAYLHQNTDFTGDIAKSDCVCLTCYKSHSALTKTNCTSRDGLPLVSQSANKEVLVQVSPINSKEMKFVNLLALDAALGNDPDLSGLEAVNLAQILQTLFVCTGCDYISFFYGIGKATFLRYFFQNASFITGSNAEGSLANVQLDNENFNKGFLAFIRLVGTVYYKKHASAFDFPSPATHFLQFSASSH